MESELCPNHQHCPLIAGLRAKKDDDFQHSSTHLEKLSVRSGLRTGGESFINDRERQVENPYQDLRLNSRLVKNSVRFGESHLRPSCRDKTAVILTLHHAPENARDDDGVAGGFGWMTMGLPESKLVGCHFEKRE